MTDFLDRARGALLGLATGDALGAPLEFADRDEEPMISDMVGGGPFNLVAGQWTDDTALALCLSDSLIANQGLDTHDLMHRFVRWWRAGENSVTDHCFDIGMTTAQALHRFESTGDILVGPDPQKAGDADTVGGAVTGQLAGAIWGARAIPERWLAKLAWREATKPA